MVDTKSELGDRPFADNKKQECAFSKNILKSLVGLERAENALKSISMSSLPQSKQKKSFSIDCKSFYAVHQVL